MQRRRTKILATLGPSTDGPDLASALIAAGVDGVRINCSHGTPDEWIRRVTEVRAAAAAAGREIAVVFDLQGPKVRLAPDTPKRLIRVGQEVTFVYGETTAKGVIAVNWAGFVGAVSPGLSQLIVGDGEPRFELVRVTGKGKNRRVVGRCIGAGRISPSRGVVITYDKSRRRSAMTAKDRADLKYAARCEADFIALSYVRSERDIETLRGLLNKAGLSARVIAKIETIEACEALDDIVRESDAAMVARGDLGVQVGVAEVPALQRKIVRACRDQGKLAIMATQMLESMVAGGGPTRAEATDIATAVVQGASALMLSAETAVGKNAIGAVRAMDEITTAADNAEVPRPPAAHSRGPEESVMQAAALLGNDVKAAAFVVPTQGGRSVRALSRHRPGAIIVALAHSVPVARQLALEWGVIPAVLPAGSTIDETIEQAIVRVKEIVEMPRGSRVVVTSGPTVGASGGTRAIALRSIR